MALTEHDTAASPDPPRDPVLDRAYAAGASEEPPARLDASILAAARREVGARPRGMESRLRTWRVPVALAAVLVLSVSVVLLMREEGADRLEQSATRAPSVAESVRAPEPVAPSPKGEVASDAAPLRDAAPQILGSPAPQPKAAEEDRRKDQPSRDVMQAPPPRAAEALRSAPRPFAEPPAAPAEARRAAPEAPPPQTSTLAKELEPGAGAGVRERAATAERELQAQRAPALPAERTPATPPVAAAPDAAVGGLARPQARARQATPESANRTEQKLRDDVAAGGPKPVWQGFERQPPEKWLERVEELLRAGRDAEAREMLVEFRRRFPQHPVPSALDR